MYCKYLIKHKVETVFKGQISHIRDALHVKDAVYIHFVDLLHIKELQIPSI